MADVLIVSGEKAWQPLRAMFAPPPAQAKLAANAGEARRMLAASTARPALVVVNTPLPDEFGQEFAAQCAAKGADVLVLAAAPQAEKLAAGLQRHGVFVLAKPLSSQQAAFALRLVRAARARAEKLEQENRRLLKKLDEMRTLSRAKCALVRYCGMTEAQAHHALEQRAMDARISLRDAALAVLNTYGEA